MSTRYFSWGKGGRCVRLTTYHPCSAERQENLGPYFGSPQPVVGDLYLFTGCFVHYDSVFSIWGTMLYPWWFSVRHAACMTRIFHAQNHWCIFPFPLINGGWLILHLFRKCVMHEWLCVCKSVVECFSVWMCIFIIYTIWEIHMLLCFMKYMQLLTQLIVRRHSHVSVH